MGKKQIGSSFTVTTLVDGTSPDYIQTQEAWSNVVSVANAATEPTPNSGWYDYTPPKGTYTYLWRRSRPMTYNGSTQAYTAGNWSYQRLTGENGTSIDIDGEVALHTDMESNGYVTPVGGTRHLATDGESYVLQEAWIDGDINRQGHLFMWSTESNSWVPLGQFQGKSGETYFTHIGWARSVTFKTPSTPPTGQLTKPNASSVTGFDVAPSSDKPYMGVLVNQTVEDSTRGLDYTWQYNKGAKGDQGDSTIFADVTNEMGSMACDSNGNTTSEQSVDTIVTMFNGHTAISGFSSIKCYIDSFELSNSYSTALNPTGSWRAVVNLSTGLVTIYAKAGVSLTSPEIVTITASATISGTSYTRDVRMSVNGVRAGQNGQNAVLQELVPSLNSLSFSIDSNNNLTPSGYNLTLSIKRTVGGTTSTQTITQSGLTIRYSVYEMPSSNDSGTPWGNSDGTSGITWSGTTATISNSVAVQRIYIAAFNSSGVLVDRETIPIVKGGEKGIIYEARPSVTSVTIPSGGSSIGLSAVVRFFKRQGNDQAELYSVYYAIYRRAGGSYRLFTQNEGYKNNGQGTEATINGTVSSVYDAVVVYAFSSAYTGTSPETQFYLAKCEIPILRDGKEGARGKTGRMYYYAGEFNVSDTDSTFKVTDYETPFFLFNNNYYVWIGPIGDYTMEEMGAPYTDSGGQREYNENFEIMVTDFKYLITEAIFGNFAKFGSALISGDWMMSQYGLIYDASDNATSINSDDASVTIDGVVYNYSNAYRAFDPTSPNESLRGFVNFVPNYSVDLKRGWSYQNVADVKGQFKSGGYDRSTFLSAAQLEMGYKGASILDIQCEGDGTSSNIRVRLGRGEGGFTYMELQSRGLFNNKRTTMLTIHNMEGGVNPRSIVIHKGGIAMTNPLDDTIIKQKTWDELLS